MSIHSNPMSIKRRSSTNPLPIWYRIDANLKSIKRQSKANQVSTHSYPDVNIAIQSQSMAYPPIWRQKLTHLPILDQFNVNPHPASIKCQTCVNLMPIQCQSLMQSLCQSILHQMSIKYQSINNPSIQPQSKSINVNPYGRFAYS